MSIDPNNLAGTAHLTFDDEFNSLSLWSPSNPSGTWATTFWYEDPNGNGGTLASNGEQEWYINSNYGPTSSVQPWTANNGVLTITAAPASPTISSLINGYGYTSGELNTYHSFSQTYGFFEMSAKLPAGQGFWPAFWLMPENGSWPPELDIMEVLGQNPTILYNTVHSDTTGSPTQVGDGGVTVADMSTGFHTYGVDWEPNTITFYFDGQAVWQTATPSDMNSPMYMLLNLADGGYWPGSASGAAGQMQVDWVRVYADGPGSSSSGSSSISGGSTSSTGSSGGSGDASSSAVTVSAASYTAPSGVASITLSGWNQTVQGNNAGDTFYSDNAQNHLIGGTGNDIFYLGRGGDNAVSGGGTDTFVFDQVPWAGGHISGFSGQDMLDLPFLQTYGYAGSNPIADGRLKLVSDGQGDTQVWIDLDGLSGASGTWLVTTLDGVNPANLAWQNGALVDPPSSAGSSGSSGGLSSGAAGQTFTSDNNGDHWTGTAGNDTFNVGRGGDVLTGNGGSDAYDFAQVPWAHAEITDFNANDAINLNGMFSSVGYTGSSPLTDGHLQFVSDGNGGTAVMFNANGLSGSGGTWEVVDLDHVNPSSLTLSGGVITEGTPSSSSSASVTGQTFTSDNNGDHWTGTSGNDTFNVGRGGDVLIGGGGSDTFNFSQVPWAHAEITDWSSLDTINLTGMFASVGYTGTNPLSDGHLQLVDDGAGDTQVWFNANNLPLGSGGTWEIAQLDHTASSSLHVNGAFITG